MTKLGRLATIVFTFMGVVTGAIHAAEPIKLGAVVPLNEISGRQSANSMKLAVKEINKAGGVIGRPLELIIEDDAMNPDKGAAALEKLATVDNVDVFVGGISSTVHLAQIPVMKKYKKVAVWTGSASTKVERALKDQDWFFHLHPWDYLQSQSQIDGWRALSKKYPQVKVQKWFIAYEDGSFGTMTNKAYSEQIHNSWKQQSAAFKSAASGGGDYQGVLKRAKEENPDVFVWVGYEADAIPLMSQAKEIGFYPPNFVGFTPGWPVDFGKSPTAENLIFYGAWVSLMKNVSKASRHYMDAYMNEFNEEPTMHFGPLGYSSIYILAEAIEKAGSLDTQTLIAALEQTRYESPLGETITFKPSKIIKHQGLQGLKIMQWQKGVQQVIWPFEHATATFKYPYKP